MIPLGSAIVTSRSSPPNMTSRIAPASMPPIEVLVSSESGTTMNAPSTGPQTVPRPPSRTTSTTCMLSTMSNIVPTVRKLT